MTEINAELKKWKIQETIDEEDIDWGNVEDVTETSVKIWITGKEMAEERINNKALRCYALMVNNDAIRSKLVYKNVEEKVRYKVQPRSNTDKRKNILVSLDICKEKEADRKNEVSYWNFMLGAVILGFSVCFSSPVILTRFL